MLRRKWAIAWQQRFAITTSSFALLFTLPSQLPTPAVEVPTTATPISKAPYSQVFFTGSAYAVKDHDFSGDNPSIGVSSVWVDNPSKGSFQVGVRYCLPGDSLVTSSSSLTSLVLMDKDKFLVSINQRLKTTPSQQRVLRPDYQVYRVRDPFWDNGLFYEGIDPYWDDFGDFGYSSPAYSPAVTCSAGGSRFDISQLAPALANLPSQTLQVKLVFSNGATSNWRLGEKTVQALKELLVIHATPTHTAKSSATNLKNQAPAP